MLTVVTYLVEVFIYFLNYEKAVLTKKNVFLVLKTSMEPFLVGFGASGVGFGAADVGSEVSFANNGVWRSEMWGSPSLPHPLPYS